MFVDCGMFLGCLLYADDLILLSPSVVGLQEMLNRSCEISHSVSLQYNIRKCHCMVVERMYKAVISPIILDGQAACTFWLMVACSLSLCVLILSVHICRILCLIICLYFFGE